MGAVIAADYLVVGAGASGMAFVDALITHANVHVVMVDRRHGPGGHWLDAYPFVRLHQASDFYGVASTLLGEGRLQDSGPEAGLHERATAPEICAYYQRVLQRMVGSGRVEFHSGCEYLGGRAFVSRVSGRRFEVTETARLVITDYLGPDIPATTPPPFGIGAGARVIPVNDLVKVTEAPSRYVIVGSGKTATDACIWLLSKDVDPDAICWVRSREPWMINRAALQPEPEVFYRSAGDIMAAAVVATSPDDLFLRLEAAGVMLRIDRSVTPTMAKTPTIGVWEVDKLRTIEDVVRLGHLEHVDPGRLQFAAGDFRIPADSLVVHCAASGLKYAPVVPIWQPQAITLQPVRAGFPCFGAAITGYVEATRDDDAEKNRLCLPSPLPDTPASWARMQVMGGRASTAFALESDIRAWASRTTLNPARIPPEKADDPGVRAAAARFRAAVGPGLERMAQLAGMVDVAGPAAA
ncbi:MAG: NAD(P)/FAD-dependent oxidoreductase [Micrococcus sp.]|nr:NAD(P)/FAD-dependent oxidoreductase [Micrococcus sp.]